MCLCHQASQNPDPGFCQIQIPDLKPKQESRLKNMTLETFINNFDQINVSPGGDEGGFGVVEKGIWIPV